MTEQKEIQSRAGRPDVPPPLPYRDNGPSYDDRRRGARLVIWLCCRRPVYSVDPSKGCAACR